MTALSDFSGSAAQVVKAAQSEGRKLRRKPPKRPSLYDDLRLADGRLVKPLMDAVGIHDATFRSRLKRGLSPDQALLWPVQSPGPRRRVRHQPQVRVPDAFWRVRHVKMADGSPAWVTCIASGVSGAALAIRLHRGWSVQDAATRPMAVRRRRMVWGDEDE